jgi:predicted DNA-binding transcriptional regulator YafY
MVVTERLIRIFKILHAIQARPGISAKELAELCETTERTIYRDLRLVDLIVPITNEGYGKGTVSPAIFPCIR